MTDLVPDQTLVAAKRGFIRTTAQSYGATLTTGISASVVTGLATGEVQILPTVITLAVALVAPVIAGAASYFSILGDGIPEDYTGETE